MATVYGVTVGVLPAIKFKVQEFSRANHFNIVSLICTASIYKCKADQISEPHFIEVLQLEVSSQRFPNENEVMVELAEKVLAFVTGVKTSDSQGQSAFFTISVLMSGYNKTLKDRSTLVEQSNEFIGVFNFSDERPASIFKGFRK